MLTLEEIEEKLPLGVQKIIPEVVGDSVAYYMKYIPAPNLPGKDMLDDIAKYFLQYFSDDDLQTLDKDKEEFSSDDLALSTALHSWVLKMKELKYSMVRFGLFEDFPRVPAINLTSGFYKENDWNSDIEAATFNEAALKELQDEIRPFVTNQRWNRSPALGSCKLVRVNPGPRVGAKNRKHLRDHTWYILIPEDSDKVMVTRGKTMNAQYICNDLDDAIKHAVYLLS